MKTFAFSILVLLAAFCASNAATQESNLENKRLAKEPWREMNYGPFLTASINAPAPSNNIAYKGIAVNLGVNCGGEQNEAIVFDTDLLRYSAGWTGDFVALKGVVFDGRHGEFPAINGQQVFGNPALPGWGYAGEFADPREYPYGPIPRTWAHWKGLYLHERDVIFSYEVGGVGILELPGLERRGSDMAFTRTINLAPSAKEQIVQVVFDAAKHGELLHAQTLDPAADSSDAVQAIAILGSGAEPGSTDKILAAAFVGPSKTAKWLATKDGHIRLKLSASKTPTRIKLLIWRGAREWLAGFAKLAASSARPADLNPLTHGGPPRWGEKLATQGKPGSNEGPYAIDTITAPDKNPWNSWLRFGGMDFFSNGKRAALSTWSGDVWVVSGVDGSLEKLTWQRIASGLFQPLGLKIVEDRIYVLGRDQITLLQDLNGDGETDFYQNFNNDCMVSQHFHEFAADLKTDAEGNFYYAKCACHGREAFHPHNGTLLKLPRDGSKLEVVARGFRAVNGLGIGPHGEFTCVDNQGHWMPGNRINWIKPGGWYGYQWAWNPEHRTTYEEPLCWIHDFVDRSGGTHLWVPTDQWGPLEGNMITISYGMGRMFLLLKEEVDGTIQGGVTRFPMDFETGVMRGVFHPQNHQLYTCGLFGWAGDKTKPGGFYRVRYTGKQLHMPVALNIARDGVVVGFTDPLDVDSATDPGNYDVKCWNYHWTEKYGSPDFKLDGQEGRDTLTVASATLSADHKSVFLNLPGIQRVMQMHIAMNVKAADGTRIDNFVHHTIHKLGARAGLDMLGAGAVSRTRETKIELGREAAGLVEVLTSKKNPSQTDVRRVRLPALFVPAQTPPTPFLDAGMFEANWEGFLKLDLPEEVVFGIEGNGSARLRINDQLVYDESASSLGNLPSKPVTLHAGLNRLQLTYQSPPKSDAEFRLTWKSKRFPQEPVPPAVFVHDAMDPALQERELCRQGRALFAASRCANCHRSEAPWTQDAMPELTADAPTFNGIGSRLNEAWLANWIADPKSVRPDARMPRLLRADTTKVDARDIAAFLASLMGANGSTVAAKTLERGVVEKGERMFADFGCVACHLTFGDKPLANDPRTSLGYVKAKWQTAALENFLRAPSQHYRWIRMPDFKLSATEATALTAFVLARSDDVPPVPSAQSPANVEHGHSLVLSLGCLNCHKLDGEREIPVAPKLADLLQRDWQRGCLAGDAASRGRAPDFSFAGTEREALREFSSADALAALQRDTAAEFAARQYTALRCNACHRRDQETDLWSRLQSSVNIPVVGKDMDEESAAIAGSVHVGRPPLTFAGEKLYAGWMERFLNGTLPYKPRPELQGRMPAFPAYAKGLAEGLAQQHGFSGSKPSSPPADAELAAVGKRLIAAADGFSCVQCHDVGDQKALAGKDTATVNFAHVADRLRQSYYWRYVQDPLRVLPGTMMPRFIGDDGTTQLKSIYGGDPRRQFEAIWNYLQSLSQPAASR